MEKQAEISELVKAQQRFMRMLPRLLDYFHDHGYEVRGGDLFAKTGHMEGSLHYSRLAIDLIVHKDGVQLEHGYQFRDGGHFSLLYGGRK